MDGVVLQFDGQSGRGLIRGRDGNRYPFTDRDWIDRNHRPANGQGVDFDVAGDTAQQIMVIQPVATANVTGAVLSQGSANGMALGIVSIGCGILSLVPGFGVIPAIIGLMAGFFGRRQAKAADNPIGMMMNGIGLAASSVLLIVDVLIVLAFTGGLFIGASS